MVNIKSDIVKKKEEVDELKVNEEVDKGMYENDEFRRDFKRKDESDKKKY